MQIQTELKATEIFVISMMVSVQKPFVNVLCNYASNDFVTEMRGLKMKIVIDCHQHLMTPNRDNHFTIFLHQLNFYNITRYTITQKTIDIFKKNY